MPTTTEPPDFRAPIDPGSPEDAAYAKGRDAERAEIQAMANMLDEAGIGHHEGDTVRSRLARMIADANTEARRTEQAEAERDALADRNLDLGRELEALRAAVRAHREAARAAGKLHPRRDLDLWAAAKA